MKIIFKPTNKLVEKLILDERLILNEADNTEVFQKDASVISKFQNILSTDLDVLSGLAKEISQNILKADNTSLQLINQAKTTLKDVNLVQPKPNTHNAQVKTAYDSLSTFCDALSKYYNTIINIKNDSISKNTANLNTALTNLIKNKEQLKVSKNTKSIKKMLEIDLTDVQTNLANIDKIITETLNNLVNSYISKINEFKKDFSADAAKIDNAAKRFKFAETRSDKEIAETNKILNDFLNKFNNSFNEIDPNLKKSFMDKNINALNLKNLDKQTLIKLLPKLTQNVNALKTEYDKVIDELEGMYNLSASNQNTADEKQTYTANIDWAQKFKEIWTNDKISAYKRYDVINEFWNEYYSKVWNKNVEAVKNLGNAFKDECMRLGFEANKNPFIYFLQELFNHNIFPDSKSYTAIHNCANKGIISSDDLKNVSADNINLVLFSKNLYAQPENDIVKYIKLYSDISEDISSLKLSNKILVEKYGNNKRELLVDLFFEPGKPLAATKDRIAGNTNDKLKKISDIQEEWKAISGKDASANVSDKINYSAKEIADEAKSKEAARKIIQFLLVNYNEKNKNISKNIVDEINTICGIDPNKFSYTPSESMMITNYFKDSANIKEIMLDAIKLMIKNQFKKDLDTDLSKQNGN